MLLPADLCFRIQTWSRSTESFSSPRFTDTTNTSLPPAGAQAGSRRTTVDHHHQHHEEEEEHGALLLQNFFSWLNSININISLVCWSVCVHCQRVWTSCQPLLAAQFSRCSHKHHWITLTRRKSSLMTILRTSCSLFALMFERIYGRLLWINIWYDYVIRRYQSN